MGTQGPCRLPCHRHKARPCRRVPSAAHLTGDAARVWPPPRNFFALAPFFGEPVGTIRPEHSSGGGVSAAGGARMGERPCTVCS
jgi:hypothetical protein